VSAVNPSEAVQVTRAPAVCWETSRSTVKPSHGGIRPRTDGQDADGLVDDGVRGGGLLQLPVLRPQPFHLFHQLTADADVD
jgi:hypothetical protein